ncbi:GapA-binding peptide SR1P [Thalassobacillus pellis]|nr:GapA-binding peptide SR1P [Thalassobacillus pellis]MBM7552913.1 putative Zn-ribbon and HTH transcriptional regulator [Thalassobacillus pellis]
MGTIVCQDCQQIIEHYDDEKVSTLYSKCPSCNSEEE